MSTREHLDSILKGYQSGNKNWRTVLRSQWSRSGGVSETARTREVLEVK